MFLVVFHDSAWGLTTVNHHAMSSDVRALAARQKQCRICNLSHVTHSAQHDILCLEFLPLVITPVVGLAFVGRDGRLDGTGTHRIAADVVSAHSEY
jgi:hypothetical protein